MEKYSKITIDKAVQLTQKCLCCNSITEIEEALNSYNKKMVLSIQLKLSTSYIQPKIVQIVI